MMVESVIISGQKRVSPSVAFKLNAQTTSSTPARRSASQAVTWVISLGAEAHSDGGRGGAEINSLEGCASCLDSNQCKPKKQRRKRDDESVHGRFRTAVLKFVDA
jgi:hypothetical protein